MQNRFTHFEWLLALLVTIAVAAHLNAANSILAAEPPIRFGHQVLSILSSNCFACHGPDEKERQANLRLDIEEDAKRPHEDGIPIVPGKPNESALMRRLLTDDPDLKMPPPDSHKTVKPAEIEILRRWIAEGAVWGRHWSLEPLVAPPMPELEARGATRHPIDAFVEASLRRAGLTMQAPAPPHQLVRRLSLDLIGLPPSPDLADQFASQPSADAYERLVDQLLESPQFGEHWARLWLDLARYADTKGYEKDLGRTMWPYRDWVVRAFNRDMPLDQFTVEQLAGDLLPNPTDDQRIATAFHRNTMSNDEGGTDDEEFRVTAVKDRVDTTIQVWMGLTMGCAKCHSHKYDPITISDYYAFYALFNQTEDADRSDDSPTFAILTESRRHEREKLEREAAVLGDALKQAEKESADDSNADGKLWQTPKIVEVKSDGGAKFESRPDGSQYVRGPKPDKDVYTIRLTLGVGQHRVLRLEALPDKQDGGQLGVGRSAADPNFVVSELEMEILGADGTSRKVALQNARADFSQDGWPVAQAIDGKPETGWAVSPRKSERHVAIFDLSEPLDLQAEATAKVTLSQQYGSSLTLLRFRLSTSGEAPAKLSPLAESPAVAAAREKLNAANNRLKEFDAATPRVPVFRELPEGKLRSTKTHNRGNFLDPGDPVTPAVLPSIGALPEGAPLNRLGVAQWLVNPQNPLTPRVWANRVWARLFATGLVETEEDFGALGASPSNPELLDWLAAYYRDHGWSLKKLLKTIVMSKTYQQASTANEVLREKDPRNTLFSRGARYRLTAEVVRDQALAVSGLLSKKMEGPPVMPPQPAGLWRSTYSGQKWVDAEGEDRWRRGLYTYWKRTTPYPSMTTFDAGSREVCMIRRIHTNTPLQALVTLNDPVYVEAAAALARRMITEAEGPDARAARGLRLALIRPVRPGETEPLIQLQAAARQAFDESPENVDAFLKAGRANVPAGVAPAEFASWMAVANAILNLDELLTRN